MCRSIKPLSNYEPPATSDEITAAALQYVRKVSGARQPSKINQPAFELAVYRIAEITGTLVANLETSAPPKNREREAEKAKARAAKRSQ